MAEQPADKPSSESESSAPDRSPLDRALDVLVYAPVGLAVELSERMPGLTDEGRRRLQGPLGAARFVGQAVVNQARNGTGKRLADAVQPYFGGESSVRGSAGAPAGESMVVSDEVPKAKPDPSNLPISGYTTLSATQIVDLLSSLSPLELTAIEGYEQATRKRKSILDRVAALRLEA